MNAWNELLEQLPAALLTISRLWGIFLFGPIFGSAVIPMRVKVALAFLAALAVYPLLTSSGAIDPHAPAMRLELLSLGPLIALEVLVGMVIGYVALMPLIAAQIGGLIMGQQMGLGFAQFYNPAIDDEADVLGQILFYLALGGFLILGGHEAMILAVLHSFDHVPIGAFQPDVSLIELLTGLLTAGLELALRLAAPLLALIMLETVAMGFIAKTVPQLNILSLGFPLRILAGIGMVAAGLVVLNDVMLEEIDNTWIVLTDWLIARGPH